MDLGDRTLDELIRIVLEWFLKQLGKFLSTVNLHFDLPLSNRKVAKLLAYKYPATHFHLVHNQRAFDRLIGKILISTIKQQHTIVRDQHGPQQIRVGIVCGPMVHRVGLEIERAQLVSRRDNFKYLSFVAMNKAVERSAFQYSASYLVTFLSTLFPNSEHIAYTSDKHEAKTIADERRAPSVLLCSAGAYPIEPKSYLQKWCEKAIPSFSASLKLGAKCVGDFCLTPIDSSGNTTGDRALLDAIYDGLDPYPRFMMLGDHSLDGCKVIFPINIERESSPTARWGSRRLIPTGKEAVAKTVLRSGIVSDCVLEPDLARNLVGAVGDYLIESASAYQEDRFVRLCKVRNFRRERGRNDIYISDPLGRLDRICRLIPGNGSCATSLTIVPEIVLSENYEELKDFDFKSGRGFVKIPINGEPYKIEVRRKVRKPGQIPLLTLQMMAHQIDRICRTRGGVRVWDVGCGSGFLGLVAMRLLGDKIEKIRCSDISQDAVECTSTNIGNLKVDRHRVRVDKADLFAGTELNDSEDLIVFNSPFSPDGLPGLLEADVGGVTGMETALQFCREVRRFIRPGGSAILAVADYVDDGRIGRQLSQEFGAQHVECDERLILYPFETPSGIPQAREIRFRDEIEKKSGYRFETCTIGGKRFLEFTVRHYIAIKPNGLESIQ